MTEQEWLACRDPAPMLRFIIGKVSERKLRLFAVACSRRHLHLTQDPRVREALDIAERFADRLVGDAERSNARKAAQQAAQVRGVVARPQAPKFERRTASLAYYSTARQAMEAASNVPQLAVEVLVWLAGGPNTCSWRTIKMNEEVVQSDLLRDILGNPARPIVASPTWLTADVLALAGGIYEDRAFERLPILADGLEEAGCDNANVLQHCRSDGPHARGCWVVDLVLGKF